MSLPAPDRPHILFLFSDTGGGHRAAANAIIEALDLQFPDQTTHEMVDVFREYAPPPLTYAPEIYPPLTRVPQVWGMGYHLIDGKHRAQLLYQMMWPYIRWGLQRLLREHPADLIVSVHQLFNEPMARAIAQSDRKTPFATVVTDLVSTHAAWFTNQADLIIVPTNAAYRRALAMGISPKRLEVVGLPVANRFCQPSDDSVDARQENRKRLGWSGDRPVVLLMGGGEGMGPLEPVAQAIDAANLPIQMVIIAGRNQKLQQNLQKYSWKTLTRVYGFVQEMPDFMHAADILVTKAGPGTISEAFISGLPLILYSRLPGQEDGNVDYVVGNGAGVWAPRPDKVVKALRFWLDHPEQREAAAEACRRLARPNASRDIARLLAALAGVTETPISRS